MLETLLPVDEMYKQMPMTLTVKSIVLGLQTPDANRRVMNILDVVATVVRSAFMLMMVNESSDVGDDEVLFA